MTNIKYFLIKTKLFTSFASSILLGCVAFILLVQVLCRTFLNFSFSWPEEFSRYAMIWVSLLMASVLVHDRELIAVDFLDHLWPLSLKKYRDLLIKILFCIMFLFMTIEGLSQAFHASNQTTIALGISWFWIYLAIPIGSVLILLQMLFTIVIDFGRKDIANSIETNKIT